MDDQRIFFLLHRLGLIRLLAGMSRKVRQLLLESCDYNVDHVLNQFCSVDMVTDSFMHRFTSSSRFFSKGRAEVEMIKLNERLKKYFGFPYVFPVAQGRWAEQLLIQSLPGNPEYVIHNGLFITTITHLERRGMTGIEIPAGSADGQFGGCIDLELLENTLARVQAEGKSTIIYLEPANNARGGKPISMENMKGVQRIAAREGIPVLIDPCRILENAFFIREYEEKYRHMSAGEIVKEFLSCSVACAMSLTKDFAVEEGGFIGVRSEQLSKQIAESVLLGGDGLSVRSKARLSMALQYGFNHTRGVRRRMKSASFLSNMLLQAGLPVIEPAGGHGVFLRTSVLKAKMKGFRFPAKSFLAGLYLDSGIAASENFVSKKQMESGEEMLRFAIPRGGMSRFRLWIISRRVAKSWRNTNRMMPLEPAGEVTGSSAIMGKFRPAETTTL